MMEQSVSRDDVAVKKDEQQSEPLYDLATLQRVHEVFEFEVKSDLEMDRWLHVQILRTRLGRDITDEERRIHVNF